MCVICDCCGFLYNVVLNINFSYGFNVGSCGFYINIYIKKLIDPH